MKISLPGKSASIIVSAPLAGKKDFIYKHLRERLEEGEPVIFLLTDSSPEDIKNELVKDKFFFGKYVELFRFIDCYSQQAGNLMQDKPDTRRVAGPLALNEISIALAQLEAELHKKNEKHTVIFDSLSTLLMYSNPQMVGRFLQCLIAKIRGAGGSVIFTLEEGMHDPKDMVTIEHLMNVIINVKKEEGRVMIKASGLEGSNDWCELDAEK